MRTYIEANQLSEEYSIALSNRIALSLLGLGLNIVCANMPLHRKMVLLHEILDDPLYKSAYKTLEYRYFPIHWKLFYGCARFGCAIGVYLLLSGISNIISK